MRQLVRRRGWRLRADRLQSGSGSGGGTGGAPAPPAGGGGAGGGGRRRSNGRRYRRNRGDRRHDQRGPRDAVRRSVQPGQLHAVGPDGRRGGVAQRSDDVAVEPDDAASSPERAVARQRRQDDRADLRRMAAGRSRSDFVDHHRRGRCGGGSRDAVHHLRADVHLLGHAADDEPDAASGPVPLS